VTNVVRDFFDSILNERMKTKRKKRERKPTKNLDWVKKKQQKSRIKNIIESKDSSRKLRSAVLPCFSPSIAFLYQFPRKQERGTATENEDDRSKPNFFFSHSFSCF